MTSFLVRRLLQAVVVMLGVTLLVFVLEHILPGNLAREILGPRASAGAMRAFDRRNGLNEPILEQYGRYLANLLHGNLGYSYRLNQSVASLLGEELPRSLILVAPALVVALLVAVPLGILQAVRRNTAIDHAATGVSFVLYAMPSFWLGMVLIVVLADKAGWFPAEAPQGGGFASIVSDPRALVLPWLTVMLVSIAFFSRYMRSAAIETLAEDYIRTARAKGLPQRLVLSRHLLRNAIGPVLTLVGLSLPTVITAGLVAEYLFNFPGAGLAYWNAASNQDYPLELGITLAIGAATILGNLLADVAYAVLDPRVSFERAGRR